VTDIVHQINVSNDVPETKQNIFFVGEEIHVSLH